MEAAISCTSGTRTFDYANRCFEIVAEYNEGCDLNPSIAYFGDLSVLRTQGGEAGGNGALESSRLHFESLEAEWRASDTEFCGLLVVIWRLQDHSIIEAFPISDKEYDVSDKDWLPRLKYFVNRGLVVGGEERNRRLGRVEKIKKVWKWKELSGMTGNIGSYWFGPFG
jgi:hypothetical protein